MKNPIIATKLCVVFVFFISLFLTRSFSFLLHLLDIKRSSQKSLVHIRISYKIKPPGKVYDILRLVRNRVADREFSICVKEA